MVKSVGTPNFLNLPGHGAQSVNQEPQGLPTPVRQLQDPPRHVNTPACGAAQVVERVPVEITLNRSAVGKWQNLARFVKSC